MSSPRKRCRGACKASPAPALPSDLVLEIVARSDAATLLRCAACCKPLRRDILSPAFIRRVCHGPGAAVPPRLLCFLQSTPRWFVSPAASRASPPPPFVLAHPATPAAAYLSEKHLVPFVSRGAGGGLLARYEPVTSRGGLVVLRRRHHAHVPQEIGICVYDPMTGGCTFLPDPPEMANYSQDDGFSTYVLLTASDGGGSFILLAADFNMLLCPESCVKVLTVSSPDAAGGRGGAWSPVSSAATHRRSRCSLLHPDCSAVVLGGAVHWVMYDVRDHHLHVLTYDVRAATAGSIELPTDHFPESYGKIRKRNDSGLRLAASPDGKLTVLVRDKVTIYVWRLMSPGAAGWTRHAVIDTEPTLRALVPELHDNRIQFTTTGERSGVVLFDLSRGHEERRLIALDLETKEMHMVNTEKHIQVFLFEVDLESRLSIMKTIPSS